MSDPVRPLVRTLRQSALRIGCAVALVHERETPWQTMTFAGARHTLRATGDPAALARWVATLPEADLPLPCGRFVADCAAEASGGTAVIELLVLEE